MEREVAHRHSVRGLPLQVAQQAGAERVEPHDARVYEELGDTCPGNLAPHQPERVAAHCQGRADRDHRTSRRRDHEQLIMLPSARQ
jgi:hypothetical protein